MLDTSALPGLIKLVTVDSLITSQSYDELTKSLTSPRYIQPCLSKIISTTFLFSNRLEEKMSPHPQDRAHAHSLSDPESFWLHHASKLHWHKPPSRAIEHTTTTLSRTSTSDKKTTHPSWTWFPDGEISTTWNCVDRHVSAGNGDNVALVWESAVTDTRQEWTYKRLLDEVEVLAGVLKEEGVKKGDVVLLYSQSPLPYPSIIDDI